MMGDNIVRISGPVITYRVGNESSLVMPSHALLGPCQLF